MALGARHNSPIRRPSIPLLSLTAHHPFHLGSIAILPRAVDNHPGLGTARSRPIRTRIAANNARGKGCSFPGRVSSRASFFQRRLCFPRSPNRPSAWPAPRSPRGTSILSMFMCKMCVRRLEVGGFGVRLQARLILSSDQERDPHPSASVATHELRAESRCHFRSPSPRVLLKYERNSPG